jgi:hypothetical protein
VFNRPRTSPKWTVGLLLAWIAIACLFTVVTTRYLVADLNGGDATATVVHVYSQTAYTVSYTTKDGVGCEIKSKWDPVAHEVRTGDRFKVHYSKVRPCDNVDRADDHFARFGASVIALIFLLAGVAMLVLFRCKERRRLTAVSGQ